MLVFGIDTGSVKCGYAVVRKDGLRLDLLECGVIRAARPANDNGGKWARMQIIGMDFAALIEQYGGTTGDVCGIESAYIPVGRTFGVETLAEARGVVAFVARTHFLEVVTVSPSTVKKAVTGSGKADKAEVCKVVMRHFGLKVAPPPDATDAVGVAIAVATGSGK